jgi:hypothetical protein
LFEEKTGIEFAFIETDDGNTCFGIAMKYCMMDRRGTTKPGLISQEKLRH